MQGKTNLRNVRNNLRNVDCMLVLKGIFDGCERRRKRERRIITIIVTFKAKNNLKHGLDLLGDSQGTAKKLCDKDFAERLGELFAVICLKVKTLVLLAKG